MTDSISLKNYIASSDPDIKVKLSIALSLCWEIFGIHKKRIIHRDLNPETVNLNRKTNEVDIKESPLSVSEVDYDATILDFDRIDGNLTYISPEQTGRVNVPLDYRSDYYSLGIILFELFSGKAPFVSSDPIELIHCHIAQMPPRLDCEDDSTAIISDIIMKLLAKSPEDRYQSITGLIGDFERIVSDLESKGAVEPFQIGEMDQTAIFKFPEKLYGRYREIQTVINEYEKVKKGESRVVLISGPPGIGKSYLIHEIRDIYLKDDGNFVTGKFDQYKSDIPYSAVEEAFGELTHQILIKGEKELDTWKKIIKESIGINGQLIIDVIGDIELLIGKQREPEEIGPQERQNRFFYAFKNFIKAVSEKANPLILFLDDVQWADNASINLLEHILFDEDYSNILFLCAYRDIEARENKRLIDLINRIEKGTGKATNVNLGPV